LIWKQLQEQVQSDRKETIAAAELQNSNLAITLEQYTIRTLQEADAALQIVQNYLKENRQPSSIVQLIGSKLIDISFFDGICITDAEGTIQMMYPSNLYSYGLNFSQRDYFKRSKNSRTDSLLITKPFQSKTIGKSVIVVCRRLTDKEGNFKGVVAIQIQPKVFTAFYEKANSNRNDIMSLISPDGITYSRRTGQVQSDGEDISKSPLFKYVSANPVGSYYAKDAIKGIETHFSYRKLQDYPIIATIGRSEEDILANFYKRARNNYFFGAIISLLLLLFVIFLLITDRDRKRAAAVITREIIEAQEREREAIGHELHDNVNQILMAAKLYVEMAMKDVHSKDEKLNTSIEYIKNGISEIRKISRELSAPTLGSQTLLESIESLIEFITCCTDIIINFDHSEYKHEVDKEKSLAIYRILQEQLNNILKHAAASKIDITLKQSDKETWIIIIDNGNGFDTKARRNGIGLNNIYSRATLNKGSMTIDSAPGKGCKLEVSLPLKKK
jgi:signal transduction histidine kinase